MRLFVSDLDGTLLDKRFCISEENLLALNYAKTKGVEIAIASGRIYKDVLEICKKHDLEAYIISNNGACVYDKDGEILKCNWLLDNQVENVLKFLTENNICYQVSTSSSLYIQKDWRNLLEEDFEKMKKEKQIVDVKDLEKTKSEVLSQVGLIEIDSYNDFITRKINCYSISIVVFSEENYKKVSGFISSFKGLNLTFSGRYTLEIISKFSSKGDSVEFLADFINIPIKEVVAIGDNLNDESMIKSAGIGIAVDNADEYIKSISDFVSKECERNGVAHAIYNYLA